MDWVDLLWPMLASAGFVLGLIYAVLWLAQPQQRVHLAFAVSALSIGAITLFELASFRAASTEAMAVIIRWWHVPIALLVWSIIYQVQALSGQGSRRLAEAAAGTRLLALVLNFTTGVNLNFSAIDAIGQTMWLGVPVGYPVGQINPFMIVAQAANLLLLGYLVHALYRTGRASGMRSQAFLVCAGWLLLFVAMVGATLPLVLGQRRWPAGTSLSAVITIVLLSSLQAYELLRAGRLRSLLDESEARGRQELERVASAAGLGLWQWDVARGHLAENAVNRSLLGHGEGSGTALETLFDRADSADAVQREFEQAIRKPKYEIEYRIERPEGGHRWILLRGDVTHDAGGSPLLVQGVTADVTRRREEATLLRTLLEAAPSALLLVDEAGRVGYANAEAARVFGHDAEAMVGLRADTLMSTEVPAGYVQRRQEFMVRDRASAGSGVSDMFGQRRDGEVFPMEVRLSHLELGGESQVMAAVTDLSPRKKLEYEMAMERESVAHLARVTMLGELSGSLAHELNQPLAAILSNAQAAQRILHRDPSDLEQVQEILADIVETDRRAGQVIGRLRGLLRREAREFVPLDINAVVQECVRLMRNDLLNRRVSCRLNLMPGLPGCMGDPIQLQQVLMNLVRNACDALPEDPARRIIRIRTQRSDTGVCIEVADTGGGIPEDMLERMFMPFETTKSTGMGMGLAVCRTIVRAHGGRIRAENLRPNGARVSFDLPVQDER